MTRVILVRGVGEIGSAVAHAVFSSGQAVVIHQPLPPLTMRRHMSFADAMFDGVAQLEGVAARYIASLSRLAAMLDERREIPVLGGDVTALLQYLHPHVLVDARMRKRAIPEPQRGLAPVTIGLGPNFIAAETVDLVVETSWDGLGEIIRDGPPLPLTGEPRVLGGYGRERFVYAPAAGIFRTDYDVGTRVSCGQAVATIDAVALTAPLAGTLRGITRDNVTVPVGAKVVEVDPTGDPLSGRGIKERPRKIAQAVLEILNALPALADNRRIPSQVLHV